MDSAPPPIAASVSPWTIASGRRHDGLQAASAHAVQRESRSVNLKARAQRCHAGKIHVLGVGMNHVAEDHVTDVGRGQS